MMRPGDVQTKFMPDETEEKKALPEGRVMVVVLRPFKYNGTFVQEGDTIEMNQDRAVNHMRVGDLERDDELIQQVKDRRIAAAEAAKGDAEGDW